jgi:predicted nucleic acid-binding protein
VIRGYGLFKTVLELYASSTALPFDTAAASAFDGFSGLRIRGGTMDQRIAAIAVAHKLILLSRNRSHYAGIPGLVVEDWTI